MSVCSEGRGKIPFWLHSTKTKGDQLFALKKVRSVCEYSTESTLVEDTSPGAVLSFYRQASSR